ncbi:hypothetical protein [Flavimaricola marinus]|uniref:Uncharacterized protein n=1 Tax=Flavimaricola marinus TaxID=1819565 RepID=A0A238LG55_9RHOB|nr:hypothetical protein [Flavimaricola marinus]SMY08598.1 hypothetical protein LOM8899_02753 [Flavimaricola marinus]
MAIASYSRIPPSNRAQLEQFLFQLRPPDLASSGNPNRNALLTKQVQNCEAASKLINISREITDPCLNFEATQLINTADQLEHVRACHGPVASRCDILADAVDVYSRSMCISRDGDLLLLKANTISTCGGE